MSNADWMSDWSKAEPFSLRIGEICASMPLMYESWAPNDRIALAVASFRLVLEHHGSIHLLFRHNKNASANALARPTFEAALRTVWLAEKASDKEISGIANGRQLPIFGKLISALSSKSNPIIDGKYEGLLHSFTHGGTRALAAHYLEGEDRKRVNAAITAQVGFSLALAGSTIAQELGQLDVLTQLNNATPPI